MIGTIFVLSMTGLLFAQEKAKPEKPAEAAKPQAAKQEEVKKEEPAKPMKYRMEGIITAIDAGGKKITIKQSKVKRERTVTLGISKKMAQKLSNLKVGNLVNIWVSGKTITSLTKVE
ncbi:MAG: hypothetical protein KKH04_05020 [Proteobacteria bacterium]|nr:hypothetical protein [Pseudomonadota bacterium]